MRHNGCLHKKKSYGLGSKATAIQFVWLGSFLFFNHVSKSCMQDVSPTRFYPSTWKEANFFKIQIIATSPKTNTKNNTKNNNGHICKKQNVDFVLCVLS